MRGDFELLVHIAEKSGLFGSFHCSTRDIAKIFDISQQSASRKLRELEQKGLIKREVDFRGHTIALDSKGIEFLKQKQSKLNEILNAKKTALKGIIAKGIGEGSYYVAQYQKHFLDKLGIKPFPGTLNIAVNAREAKEFLSGLNEIMIGSFKTNQRSFGYIKCYKIIIKNAEAFIVMPERARHSDDIVEIVSSDNLRKKLKLKDGDRITCQKQ